MPFLLPTEGCQVLPPCLTGKVQILIFHLGKGCAEEALTLFMQYLPFVYLLQAGAIINIIITLVILIIFVFLPQAAAIILIEKMLFKIPRVSGKIERFYGAIVEESLYGKDPDLAEDVWDSKANSEAISRQRRRNEVCMSLKRSNIIHTMYIVKNILEIVILLAFIPFNVLHGLEAEKNLNPSECVVDVGKAPELGLQDEGHLVFRCNGKKVCYQCLEIRFIQFLGDFLPLASLCSDRVPCPCSHLQPWIIGNHG